MAVAANHRPDSAARSECERDGKTENFLFENLKRNNEIIWGMFMRTAPK